MNTEYFIMHIILEAILTIAFGIGAFAFGWAFFGDVEYINGKQHKKAKWLLLSALCLILFAGGLFWWIASGNQPWRHEYTSLHEIKDVTFPDGSKVQMFTCDNTHHNVTSMFGKVVEPKDFVIRRVRWSPLYLGLSWSSCQRCMQGDHYFLEHKSGEQPPIELTPEKPAEKK